MLQTNIIYEMALAKIDDTDESESVVTTGEPLLRLVIRHADPEISRAIVLLGSGIVALPMLARVAGLEADASLSYCEHVKASHSFATGDMCLLQERFGTLDPKSLLEEVCGGEDWIRHRIDGLSDRAVERELRLVRRWKNIGTSRLRALESRAGWALLGIPRTTDQDRIRRAFKAKALELHPDKGGDAFKFSLLQEMKGVLFAPDLSASSGTGARGDADEQKDDGQNKEPSNPEHFQTEDHGGCGYSSSGEDNSADKRNVGSSAKQQNHESNVHCTNESKREALQTGRLKAHHSIVTVWKRALQLTDEIRRIGPDSESNPLLAILRKVIQAFFIEERKSAKATGIDTFRRFLEHAAEVLGAAALVCPESAASCVASHFTKPLLSMAPGSPELETQCAHLLSELETYPSTLRKLVQISNVSGGQGELRKWGGSTQPSVGALASNTSDSTAARVLPDSLVCLSNGPHLTKPSQMQVQRDPRRSGEFGALKKRWGWQSQANALGVRASQ